jgi:biotin operon repressor
MQKIREELANLIRNKTDEELIALVMQLGAEGARVVQYADPEQAISSRGMGIVTKPVVARPNGNNRDPKRVATSDRRSDLVLKAIAASKGVSATEVADKTKLPRAHVTKAIADLKEAGKVFQGGERRFARYATTKKVATDASIASRNGGSKK